MVLPGLVTLQPYHLQEILELESHIQQYSKNEIDPVSKREILRQFLDWAGQGQCISQGLEDADGKLIAYFFLLMDPELIQTFFNPKETDLKRCAYLAQIVVKPVRRHRVQTHGPDRGVCSQRGKRQTPFGGSFPGQSLSLVPA